MDRCTDRVFYRGRSVPLNQQLYVEADHSGGVTEVQVLLDIGEDDLIAFV